MSDAWIVPIALRTPEDLSAWFLERRAGLLARCKPFADPANPQVPLGGQAACRAFSDLTDALIRRLFGVACEQSRVSPGGLPLCIVATGGYGRRELSPFSDIDITFIPQRDGVPATDRVVRAMFSLLMDVFVARCHLEVGYAYRLMEDGPTLDHQTRTGLLDARLIAGRERLFLSFEAAFWEYFNPADFIFTKCEERRAMRTKWGTTPYVVEPQLKEGAGGLRDLQTALWLVQARDHYDAAQMRGERGFQMLARQDASLPDCLRLEIAKENILRVRNALHALTGAHRDHLVATRREEVVAALTPPPPAAILQPSSSESRQPHGSRPDFGEIVEAFLADLYTDLSEIDRQGQRIQQGVEDSRLLLGIGLDCERRAIVRANDVLASDDPVWMLWASELAQRYDLAWSVDAQRAAQSLTSGPAHCGSPECGQVFTRILQNPTRLYPTLQTMSELGVLGWVLPEFDRVLRLAPADFAHEFTVGQHTLYVVRNLCELHDDPFGDGSDARSEMSAVFRDLTHPEELLLAALLHDVGKAVVGRPHAETGADMARDICTRLGWTGSAVENVVFLVRQHLLMASTSRLRDLTVEKTVREFVAEMGSTERLNALYLLTYADTRAVGAGVWTPVNGRFLRELWLRASDVLQSGDPHGPSPSEEDADVRTRGQMRRRLRNESALENLPPDEVSEHIESMPASYLLNRTPSELARDIGYVRRVRQGEIVVDFRDETPGSPGGDKQRAGYTEVTVCAPDEARPGLLARIAAALSLARVEVHGAQVVTRVGPQDRIALDTLWANYKERPLLMGKRRDVERQLQEALTGQIGLDPLLARALTPKPNQPNVPLILHEFTTEDGRLLRVELSGGEGDALLLRVCALFARLEWDIQSARITPWQNALRAAFLVCPPVGTSEACARDLVEQNLANG